MKKLKSLGKFQYKLHDGLITDKKYYWHYVMYGSNSLFTDFKLYKN